MAILYFLAEEPVKNDQWQDCFLIVGIYASDWDDDQWFQQGAENAIEDDRKRDARNARRFPMDSRPRLKPMKSQPKRSKKAVEQ